MRSGASAAAGAAAPQSWAMPADEVLRAVGTTRDGLPAKTAQALLAARRARRGHHHGAGWGRILARQFTSPIVLILAAATVVSMAVGDLTDGLIILAIIVASGLLGFAQDFRASRDVAALLASVHVEVTVLRDSLPTPVPVADVVPGDIVRLSAGTVVPADCRLIDSSALNVDECALTGESFPVEKDAGAVLDASTALANRTTMVYFGTHVASGRGEAVAVGVGDDTELGRISADLRSTEPPTAYSEGITRFGLLLVRLMLGLTVFIFVVNTVFGRPLLEALLFSLALAVGLTPQMLPAIVSISLSSGARMMARKLVIVKRLEAIEDFGSMDVLCTDKTGTLTQGAPQLDLALDTSGREAGHVLNLAALNAGLQAGFVNPMDAAIVARQAPPAGAVALAEIPYDFTRKRLSVLVDVGRGPQLIVKGAFQSVLDCCTQALVEGTEVPIGQIVGGVRDRFEQLSRDGYRVLALATRTMPEAREPAVLSPGDERDLTLRGLLAFHDPVKPGTAEAIAELARLGVTLRVITGDHELAARSVAQSVGLSVERVLTGPQIDDLDDAELAEAMEGVAVFAQIQPHSKRRIVLALRGTGGGVGYLGDGINDAPALHAADVGISVDTAVDVAKEAAAVVLLQKDLGVVIDGVRLGRRTFANTRKYVRLTTSANLGNMLSMAAASLFLPFLPLLPMQILLLNFLSDIPALAIASDEVDAEQTQGPATWDMRDVLRFLLVFGAVSTAFDLITFAVLLWHLQVTPVEFRSAWFIQSTITELLVLFSLRTYRPMFHSRPSTLLLALSVAVGAAVVVIPFAPTLGSDLGLAPPQASLLAILAVIAVAYVATNEFVKARYARNRAARAATTG